MKKTNLALFSVAAGILFLMLTLSNISSQPANLPPPSTLSVSTDTNGLVVAPTNFFLSNIIAGPNITISTNGTHNGLGILITAAGAGAGAGESNWVSHIGDTNNTDRFSWWHSKVGPTNYLATLSAGANIVITNEGTNFVFASTASGGGGNLATNANQFGASVTLTIKEQARLTNTWFETGSDLSAPSMAAANDGSTGVNFGGNEDGYLVGDGTIIAYWSSAGAFIASNILYVENALYPNNATASRAAEINSAGQLTNSVTTSTELALLSGVTGTIANEAYVDAATNALSGVLIADLNSASNVLRTAAETYADAATNALAGVLTADINSASNVLRSAAEAYADAATNALAGVLTSDLNAASNILHAFTITATNDLSGVLIADLNSASNVLRTAAETYADAATNALAGVLTGDINTSSNALRTYVQSQPHGWTLMTNAVPVGAETNFNFTAGANITILSTNVSGTNMINISASSGGDPTMETNGVAVGTESTWNFIAGDNITLLATNIGGNNDIMITGAAGGGGGGTNFESIIITNRIITVLTNDPSALSDATNWVADFGAEEYSVIRLALVDAVNFVHATNGVTAQERRITYYLEAGGSDRLLTFPSDWQFLGSTVPTVLTNGTLGILEVNAYGPTVDDSQTNVVALYSAVGYGVGPDPYNSPTTTRGDIIVRDASQDNRLAVGDHPGRILTSDGTDAYWAGPDRGWTIAEDWTDEGTTGGGNYGWNLNVTGGSESHSAVAATATHPHVVAIRTGTTSTDRACLYLDRGGVFVGGGELYFEAYIVLPTLSTAGEEYRVMIGLGDTRDDPDQANGIYFVYDRLTSVDWYCATADASTISEGITVSTAVSTDFTKLAFLINAAGTSVQYWIDDVLVHTETSNIPSADFGPMWQIEGSAGTSVRVFGCDYVYYRGEVAR